MMRISKIVRRFVFLVAPVLLGGALGTGCSANSQSAWPPAPAVPAIDDARDSSQVFAMSFAKRADSGRWHVTFRFQPAASVKSVHLAGSFNNWSRDAAPMKPIEAGAYAATLDLPEGVYQYKFVVNGDQWLADPKNDDREQDNHGGFNSVLRLGRLARLKDSPATVGDGAIDQIGLEHDAGRARYWQVLDAHHALVRYRTLSHDVQSVRIAFRGGEQTTLTTVDDGPLFTLWEAVVSLPAQRNTLEYTFVLNDGAATFTDPATYRKVMQQSPEFQTPDWAKNAIWYQIMVDRFRNGSTQNDPTPVHSWTSDWFELADYEGKNGATFYKNAVFERLYGGDIVGLEEKLPYLKDLGVTALYLNPVFIARTHHKYDATNYVHIDPYYGVGKDDDYAQISAHEDLLDASTWKWTKSDRVFLNFLRKARSMGFRVIIDGVFNHVGTDHPAFQDVLSNGKNSRFADWFDVTSWTPFKYNGWGGYGGLPAFRKSSDGLASRSLVTHLFAVTRRWMDPNGDGDPSDGIDGWRLDVPNEIPLPFWAEWHKLVKSINPDAYITGEIWDRADQWVDGKHFDAVMNYEFARPAVSWTLYRNKKVMPSELDRRLRELRLAYPWASTLVMMNLVDSHDTDRVASMAKNPDRLYDQENRSQDNGPNYDNSKPGPVDYQRVRLLLLLQMTYVGAPMIWNGDEVGMWGADDPSCRKPLLWEDLQPYAKPDENFVMKDHLAFYKKAIALRASNTALRTGSFRTLTVDDFADVWAFVRSDEGQHLLVALNASPNPRAARIPLRDNLPTNWSVIFAEPTDTSAKRDPRYADGAAFSADKSGIITLEIPPYSGVVLRAER